MRNQNIFQRGNEMANIFLNFLKSWGMFQESKGTKNKL